MRDYETMEMVCARAEEALRKSSRDADFFKPGDVAVIKDLLKVMHISESLLEDAEGGYSGGYSGEGGRGGNSGYSGNDRYERGSSYARRRDSRGRYSRRGYSSAYYRDGMMDHIEAMMSEAENDEQREMIRRFKEQMM